jgi:pimeloyl-ACP methyl ester carboxylesterase
VGHLGISAWILFVGYNLIAYQAWGVDPAVLRDGARVRVEEGEHTLRFLPRGEARGAGLLFFPGALVEPEAYAPLLYRVAEAGHPAVLVKLPLRAAPSASHEAEAVARAFAVLREPSLGTRWVVGGHSKGGKISLRAAAAAPEGLAGLLLIGTSHPRRQDLSGLPLPVTKVYATRDGLASPEEVRAFAPNLPPDRRKLSGLPGKSGRPS